jgi:hypothetical protein
MSIAPVIRIAINILYCHLISSPRGGGSSGVRRVPQRWHSFAASAFGCAQYGQRLLDSMPVPGIAGTAQRLKHTTAKRGKRHELQRAGAVRRSKCSRATKI